MGDAVKAFVAGVVAIGCIAAVGLHASGLGTVVGKAGTAGQGLLSTAEKG
jgi:hypothetical protein